MKHRFELKSKDQAKESAIFYKCYLNRTRFVYGVGLKIFPELWDEITERPIASKSTIKEYKSEIQNIEVRLVNLKTRIENICNAVEAFILNCQLQNVEIYLTDLKLHLDEKVMKSKKTNDPRKTLKETEFKSDSGEDLRLINVYLERFIYEIRNGKRTIRSGNQSNKKFFRCIISEGYSFSSRIKQYD